jgi:hypothetical protein
MMSAVMEASANFQLKVGLAPCIGFLPLLCFHCDHCYSNRLRNHHIREVTCSAKGKKKERPTKSKMVTMDGEMWHWNNKLQSQDLSRMHMLQILGSFEVSARKSSCSYAYFTSIHTHTHARTGEKVPSSSWHLIA